jgi:hypothetical protein
MKKQNNSIKFSELRTEYNVFTYNSYIYRITEIGLEIEFSFKIDDFIEFNPRIIIPNHKSIDFNRISDNMLSQLVFNIGMVELISYWKAICPKRVVINDYYLSEKQIAFWKKIYYHGLGEFFYLNGISISMDDFMQIEVKENAKKLIIESLDVEESALIPVGGGKDSVVSLEILKGLKGNMALIMNPRGASSATANIAGLEQDTVVVKRFLDKKLLKLNEQGFLNGHTPFSALLAFVSVLAAAVTGKKYIALSNESSANESTVVGTMVNHQYSKSLEFEADFREYVRESLTTDIHYFSLLRPLSELQIASIFAKNSSYFNDFRSCNVGSKTNIWCGKCSKCLFTFIILSPFLEPKVLVEIFGNNLLDDSELKLYFDELTGVAELKPFECVGTVDEVNIALCLAMKMYDAELPYLLNIFKESVEKSYCNTIRNTLDLNSIETEHFLEDKFLNILKNRLNA